MVLSKQRPPHVSVAVVVQAQWLLSGHGFCGGTTGLKSEFMGAKPAPELKGHSETVSFHSGA